LSKGRTREGQAARLEKKTISSIFRKKEGSSKRRERTSAGEEWPSNSFHGEGD